MKKTKTAMQLELAGTITGVGWANVEQACVYASISRDTIKTWLASGLTHSRIGGLVRIKYSDIDEYIRRFQPGQGDAVDCSRAARDILQSIAR